MPEMTPEEAAGILRKASMKTFWEGGDRQRACRLGAEAIELLAWWFDESHVDGRLALQNKRDNSHIAWSVDRWIEELRAEKKASAE